MIAQRAIQIACIAAAGAAWQLASLSGAIDPLILPAPAAVARALVAILASLTWLSAVGTTLVELAAAFAFAALLGSATGFAISRSVYAVRVFDPLLAALYSIPTILLFPLYVLFFGIGPLSKIAAGATIAFFPIAMSTIAGFATVNRVYVAAALSMGASSAQLFCFVMLPGAFPVVIAGLRLGMLLSFFTILGAETLASSAGLGHEVVTMAESLEPAKMYAYITITVIVAWLLNVLTSAIESRGSSVE